MLMFKLLASILVCAILAGCSDKTEEKQPPKAGAQTSAAAAVNEPLKPAVLDEANASRDISILTDRQWKLYMAQPRDVEDGEIMINRDKLAQDGFPSYFTISFSDSGISGTAAPNKYMASCEYGANNKLSLGEIASTKMFALRESGDFTESEYLNHLRYVSEWQANEDNVLILHTPDVSLYFLGYIEGKKSAEEDIKAAD